MRSSNIPGSYIFLLFFSHFELYAIFIRFSSIIAQFPKNILTLVTFHQCSPNRIIFSSHKKESCYSRILRLRRVAL